MQCPHCGGVLEIVTDAIEGVLYIPAIMVRTRPSLLLRLEHHTVIACTECEYVDRRRKTWSHSVSATPTAKLEP